MKLKPLKVSCRGIDSRTVSCPEMEFLNEQELFLLINSTRISGKNWLKIFNDAICDAISTEVRIIIHREYEEMQQCLATDRPDPQ